MTHLTPVSARCRYPTSSRFRSFKMRQTPTKLVSWSLWMEVHHPRGETNLSKVAMDASNDKSKTNFQVNCLSWTTNKYAYVSFKGLRKRFWFWAETTITFLKRALNNLTNQKYTKLLSRIKLNYFVTWR